jgi:hypothetical protein
MNDEQLYGKKVYDSQGVVRHRVGGVVNTAQSCVVPTYQIMAAIAEIDSKYGQGEDDGCFSPHDYAELANLTMWAIREHKTTDELAELIMDWEATLGPHIEADLATPLIEAVLRQVEKAENNNLY